MFDDGYHLRVTVRPWDGEKHLIPVPGVPARPAPDAADGRPRLAVRTLLVNPAPRSEVTTADGTVMAVEAVAEGLTFAVLTLGREPLNSSVS